MIKITVGTKETPVRFSYANVQMVVIQSILSASLSQSRTSNRLKKSKTLFKKPPRKIKISLAVRSHPI